MVEIARVPRVVDNVTRVEPELSPIERPASAEVAEGSTRFVVVAVAVNPATGAAHASRDATMTMTPMIGSARDVGRTGVFDA